MKSVVICGAGEVGRYSAEVLSRDGHPVTVIDHDPQKLELLEQTLDVRSLEGNGTQADVQREAGVAQAELFIAATHIDEINLLAAAIARGVGARQCIARIHHSTYFENHGLDYAAHLGIDHLVCPEYTTAQAIAASLRSPGALAIEQFARGKIEMQSLPVSERAKVIDKPLRELRLPGSARVGAIERGGRVFLPDAETVVHAGDVVTVIGDASQFDRIRKLFHASSEISRRLIIVGGTTQSVWLCRVLERHGFSIRLFEPNEKRALELAEALPEVRVMRADAVHTDALEQERVDLVDAFVALTDDDEQNILVAARAKAMGAPSAIAVLQRATYLHLLEHVGIDRAFSPRATAVAQIQRLITPGPVRKLATLAEDAADVYEVQVPEAARRVVGEPLRTVRFPEHCLLAAVHRDREVFVPGAESQLLVGDMVIVIGPPGKDRELRALFAG